MPQKVNYVTFSDLWIFYRYFNGKWSQELANAIPPAITSLKTLSFMVQIKTKLTTSNRNFCYNVYPIVLQPSLVAHKSTRNCSQAFTLSDILSSPLMLYLIMLIRNFLGNSSVIIQCFLFKPYISQKTDVSALGHHQVYR